MRHVVRCSCHLPLSNHGQFFHAITTDQPAAISNIFYKASSATRRALSSGHFEYGESAFMKHKRDRTFVVKLPLAVAGVTGAYKALAALLRAGLTPTQLDCEGNNVLHSFIIYLVFHPTREDVVLESYRHLVHQLSLKDLHILLQQENGDGLRPVELAAQNGQGNVVLAIMDTPDSIYLTRQEIYGVTNYKWFDFTEYETTDRSISRRNKSPLMFMAHIASDDLSSKGADEFFERDLVKQWFQAKFKSNVPLLVVWFILRLAFVMLTIIYDQDVRRFDAWEGQDALPANVTHCIPDYVVVTSDDVYMAMIISMIVYCCFTILVDIWEVWQYYLDRHLYRTYRGMKMVAVQLCYYRYGHFLLCIFVLAYVAFPNFGSGYEASQFDFTKVFSSLLATWSMLYFVQVTPTIGFFIICIYQNLMDLVRFMVVYALLTLPFIQSFQVIAGSIAPNIHCTDDFDDTFSWMYVLFQITLNMQDLTDMGSDEDKMVLYTLHIVYVFIVAIMLINFLVAVMSNSVAEMSEQKHKWKAIQKASVGFTLENRFATLLNIYYKWMNQRHFVVSKGRIYLIEAAAGMPNSVSPEYSGTNGMSLA